MKRALFALVFAGCAPPASLPVARAAIAEPRPTESRDAAARHPRTTAADTIDLAFVGDVIFGRYQRDGFRPICADECASPSALFSEVRPLLRADIAVANLETPVVRELPSTAPIETRKVFGATPAHVALLREAGFTAVTVANNHWFDQRFEGVLATPALLREAALVPLGEAVSRAPWVRAVTLERRGVSVAFIAIASVLNSPLVAGRPMVPFVAVEDIERRVAPVVRATRREADVVVVIAHWGVEYEREPLSSQVRAARALIDAGATLVIGHHPHVLQRIERYRAGLVAFSLGNFLFDNDEAQQRETGVLRVSVGRAGVARAEFTPVWIEDRPMLRPVPARGDRAHRINWSLISLSVGPSPRERDGVLYWE